VLWRLGQLQEQLRKDEAQLAAQQVELQSWQAQLEQQQAALGEQLGASAADALAREGRGTRLLQRWRGARDQVCMGGWGWGRGLATALRCTCPVLCCLGEQGQFGLLPASP